MVQQKMFVVVQGDQPVAFEALHILAQRGAETAVLSELPSKLLDGHILLTGNNLPTRFPSAHLRMRGQVVYVRVNAGKRERNPGCFEVAVVEMAIRLGAMVRASSPKRHRERRYPYGRQDGYAFSAY